MDEKEISLDRTVVQTEGLLVSNMDGEKVMMSVKNGKYYNLGNVGGRIWELLASPIRIEALMEALLDEYDIDEVTCQEQVVSFLQMLKKEELIKVAAEIHG